ncbi:MAG: carbon-nitrogen hydrolase family protein [Planctomycetes bacterium]|nr:carbon-nitrogen hydrolase family protein [Planctomycetota bacterium]
MMKLRNLCLLTLIIVTVFELSDNTKGQLTDPPLPAKQLRVAVAQIPVVNDIKANIKTIAKAIDRAVAEKAEVLLTPEGSLSGYRHKFDQAQVEAGLKKLITRASSANLALALGTCFVEPDDRRCYNQVRFYNAEGKFLGFHAKTLRCGTMTKPTRGEINHYAARPLRTFQLKGITVGALICNDMWANPGCTPMPDPHLSQQLAQKGAKIIFHAVNGGRNGSEWSKKVFWPFHETNLRIRAQTGKLWIVTTDNCYPTDIPCSAPSGVIKPNGNWVVKTPDRAEQMVVYTIELQ